MYGRRRDPRIKQQKEEERKKKEEEKAAQLRAREEARRAAEDQKSVKSFLSLCFWPFFPVGAAAAAALLAF